MTNQNFKKIVIATGNAGKLIEFQRLFADLPIIFSGLSDFAGVTEIIEDGGNFAENAILKAVGYARQTKSPTLADDSGLEVAALGGAPGVFSARYGGINLSDAERCEKLLAALADVAGDNRRARFVCVVVIADENSRIQQLAAGICDGVIAAKRCGDDGFGYDSIFVPNGFEQTFAELSNEVKNKISHRAQAANEIIRSLKDF